jgi:hypothetical protein
MSQGKPLPSDFPYDGEWLIEHELFLYRPDGAQSLGGGSPRFTASGASGGTHSIGFDVVQVAEALGIGVEEVFAANQRGILTIGTNDATAFRGVPARRYVFCIGDKRGALVVETSQPVGGSFNI